MKSFKAQTPERLCIILGVICLCFVFLLRLLTLSSTPLDVTCIGGKICISSGYFSQTAVLGTHKKK